MARRVGAYCAPCRSTYRTWAEHGNSAKHRAATTSIRSSGARGSHPYRAYTLPASDAAYDAMLAERAALAQPPTIDDLPPLEYVDPEYSPPAERGHVPAPCERCGQSFRTDKGRAWHVANNPRCVKWAVRKAARKAA